MDVLSASRTVHRVLAVPTEDGVRSSRMGATDGCELPCGCWELYPGPLEEQSVLLRQSSPMSFS